MIDRKHRAVVVAGAGGVLASALAAAAFVSPDLWRLALAIDRYIVGILLFTLVPPFYSMLPDVRGAALATVFLTLMPTVLSKLVLGSPADWPLLLAVNFVYAVATLAIYRLMLGGKVA
jgi:hypothetical protein